MNDDEPIEFPIEDSIDLHTFRPGEVKSLLHDYLEAAFEKGYAEVRIIHGKGIGVLAEIVRSVLRKHPLVESFRQADANAGSWGATVAVLRRKKPGPY